MWPNSEKASSVTATDNYFFQGEKLIYEKVLYRRTVFKFLREALRQLLKYSAF